MARKAKNTEATVPAALTMDLGSLEEAPVALPKRNVTRTSGPDRFADNPFVDRVRATYTRLMEGDGNPGREITVPANAARYVTAAIRDAVQKLAEESIGVRIVYVHASDDGARELIHSKITDVPEDDRPVRIQYCGQTRKRYLSAQEKAEAKTLGFIVVGTQDTIDSSGYLAWVEAGRPMEAEENEQESVDA